MAVYTCSEYRLEMRLIGLKRRLETDTSLDETERATIEAEILKIEREMELT
jgi:hypothetical protein